MIYAYCRVSTQRQSLSRQIDNISKVYPEATFFSDKYTGTTLDRPNWNKLYKRLNAGDTVVFDSISRMSRNADEGFSLYIELFDKGINLVFLNEPHCNTDVYQKTKAQAISKTGNEIADTYIMATNTVLQIIAKEYIKIAFEQAQKERDDLCKRVSDGMESKKVKLAKQGITVTYGLKKGTKLTTKKSIQAKEIIQKHSKDFDGTLKDIDVIKLAGISRNSYYKYKAEMIKEQEQEQAVDALLVDTEFEFGRTLSLHSDATRTEDFLGRSQVEVHI